MKFTTARKIALFAAATLLGVALVSGLTSVVTEAERSPFVAAGART
jgi:hypothetical protein